MTTEPKRSSADGGRRGSSLRKKTERRLNVRLLAISVAIAVVAGVAGYFWRAHQLDGMADAFLARADELEKEQPRLAVVYLRRYLNLRPEDSAIHVRTAKLYDENAQSGGDIAAAVEQYYRALGLEPERHDLRRRIIELLPKIGRMATAETEANQLLATPGHANDPIARRVLALAALEKARLGDAKFLKRAKEEIEKVLAREPGDIDMAIELARVLRDSAAELGLTNDAAAKQADAAVERMIAARSTDPQAFLKRYGYRRHYRLAGAAQDIEKALELGPKDGQVLLVAGEHFLTGAPERDVKRAMKCYEEAIENVGTKNLDHRELAFWGLGRTHLAAGDVAHAIAAWEKGLGSVRNSNLRLYGSLVEVYLANRDLAKAGEALAKLKDGIEKSLPRMNIASRTAMTHRATRLEAQLLLARGEWPRVIPLLKQVLDTENSGRAAYLSSDEIGQARVLLAQAYAAVECWDLAASEFDELANQPNADWRRQVAAGEAWRKAGQLDRAVRYFEQATSMPGAPANLWLLLAQAHLDLQLTRAESQLRDWQPFRRAFDRAMQADSDAWQLRIMGAIWQSTQDGDEDSRAKTLALLRAGEKTHAKEREYWARLVTAYERLKQPADADRALARFTELDKNSNASVLLEIELLALRNKFDEAEKRLEKAIADATGDLRRGLRHRQMALAFASGRADVGRGRLNELLRTEPTNIRLLRQAAELALDAGDLPEVERLAASLESAEGRSGAISNFVRARKLMLESVAKKSPPPVETDRLVNELRQQRPNWAPVAWLAAQLAELRGDAKQAVNLYQQAIGLGDRRIATYERLILLLYGQNRLTEAQVYLDQMGRGSLSNERLETVSMLVAARQDQGDRAIEIAQESVKQHPKDALRRIWLSQMFQLKERKAEALAALDEAAQLAPTDARVWNALFSLHRRAGDLEAAEKALRALGEKAKLTEAQKSFALGQGFELLGKRKEAEEQYRQAMRLSPDDVNVAVRLASVVAGTNLEESESVLKGFVERNPNSNEARRALAMLLATKGGDASFKSAQELLQGQGDDAANPVENDRLRALLLANRGRTRTQRLESYAEARKLVEGIVNRAKSPESADRLILAGLYEGEASLQSDPAKLESARGQFRQVAEVANPAESHIRLYTEFLLRHAGGKLFPTDNKGEQIRRAYLTDAARHITYLESREREDKRGATPRTLLLRARWLKLNDRAREIPETINPLAEQRLATLAKETDKEKARISFILEVGQVYSSVELESEAEKWYRKAYAISERSYVALAQSLARQNKISDAIELCEKAAKAGEDPLPAIVAANLLTTADKGERSHPAVDTILAKALERHPMNADLLFAAAILRTVQERIDEAIGLFERVVKAAPKNVLALNNLATLLAEDPKRRREALEFIDQAIGLAGRQGALLDTKGTVHLLQGEDAEAVACLEEAVDAVASDPRYYFHLAAAYQKIGRAADARTAFRRALDTGLDKQVLTASDRELRTRLEKSL